MTRENSKVPDKIREVYERHVRNIKSVMRKGSFTPWKCAYSYLGRQNE